jgi:hypothetical protein
VNVDIAAYRGVLAVSYGLTNGATAQQYVETSNDGRVFSAPLSVGPTSDYRYAAQAGGIFPGDYIGTALSARRLYVVFAVSSRPPASSSSPFHQVIWGVTLRR